MKIVKFEEYCVNEMAEASEIWSDEVDVFSISMAKVQNWVEITQARQQHDINNWGYTYALKSVNDKLTEIVDQLEGFDKSKVIA